MKIQHCSTTRIFSFEVDEEEDTILYTFDVLYDEEEHEVQNIKMRLWAGLRDTPNVFQIEPDDWPLIKETVDKIISHEVPKR